MTNIVNKLGNSLDAIISQATVNEVGFKTGTIVDIQVVDSTVVISPVKKKYSLAELLDGVTPQLIGGGYDWGKPVGGEIW